jgi:hypothetical protein
VKSSPRRRGGAENKGRGLMVRDWICEIFDAAETVAVAADSIRDVVNLKGLHSITVTMPKSS